ncbi:MAG: DUF2279 domain-containing protein [Crocinitomicaceae bacterium]
MYRLLLFLVLYSSSFDLEAQNSFFSNADTLNKGRLIGVSSGVASAWGGSIIGLSQVWYDGVQKTNWHTFDDSKNWLQMDKVGHFYTAHKINQLTSDLFMWSGLKRKKAVWIGTGISLGYQTTLEMFDAYSLEWGFSWSDMAANAIGSASYLSQQLIWQEERIIPKFSYSPTKFASIRPEVLGSSFAESLLKDYNGQTYWISFSPGTFFKQSKIPKWACLSLGYSVNQKLVGSESEYIDLNTGNIYKEQREYLLTLDIDFSKIQVKRPWVKTLLKQFNYLKVPFPSLILRDGKFDGSILYF